MCARGAAQPNPLMPNALISFAFVLCSPRRSSMSAHGALPLEWRTERLVELAGTHLRSLSTLDLLDSPSVLFMDGPARQSTLDALQQLTALRTLALAVSPSSLAALARALPSTLRSFSVAVYANHDSDIEAAASGLRELPQDCSSVELNLHHFRGRPLDQEPPDSRISSAGLAALASVPPRLTKLGMQLENVAPEAILEGLWKGLVGQTSLTSLCLDGVSIMHDEVRSNHGLFPRVGWMKGGGGGGGYVHCLICLQVQTLDPLSARLSTFLSAAGGRPQDDLLQPFAPDVPHASGAPAQLPRPFRGDSSEACLIPRGLPALHAPPEPELGRAGACPG